RLLPQVRVQLIELPDFAVGAPTDITVPRIPQIGVSGLLEAAPEVEVRRQLAGYGLDVGGARRVRRADRLFVEPLGVEEAILQPRELRGAERGAAAECLRATYGPRRELRLVHREGLVVRRRFSLARGVPGFCMCQSAVEVVLGPIEETRTRPWKSLGFR